MLAPAARLFRQAGRNHMEHLWCRPGSAAMACFFFASPGGLSHGMIFFREASWAEPWHDFYFARVSQARPWHDFFSRCEIKIMPWRKINFMPWDALRHITWRGIISVGRFPLNPRYFGVMPSLLPADPQVSFGSLVSVADKQVKTQNNLAKAGSS